MTTEFIKTMLEKAKTADLIGVIPEDITIERSEPCAMTKWTYHIVITDVMTGRVVVALGNIDSGDDYSWGEEIRPSERKLYL